MRRSTKLILASFAFLMAFWLAACMPEERNAQPGSPEPPYQVTATSDPAPTDPSLSAGEETPLALFADEPNHIGMTLSDSFSVDAAVNAPDIQSADILYASSMLFDGQQVLAALFLDGKELSEKHYPNSGAIEFSDAQTLLSIDDGRIYYVTNDYRYVTFPTENFALESERYTTLTKFGEVFTRETLDFMDRDKAMEYASDTLERIIPHTAKITEFYAIDSQAMQTQKEERIQRDIDIQTRMGFTPIVNPTDGYQVRDTYTEEDEFYLAAFSVSYNDIPVTRQNYTAVSSDRSLYGSEVRLALSSKGIASLFCDSIYRIDGISESPSAFISAEQAVKKAFDEHNAIITTDKALVRSIDFEYVPVPYNDNFNDVLLVPAWTLTVDYTGLSASKDGRESSVSTNTRTVFISAVTGDVIR